jgi:hypothetical protein
MITEIFFLKYWILLIACISGFFCIGTVLFPIGHLKKLKSNQMYIIQIILGLYFFVCAVVCYLTSFRTTLSGFLIILLLFGFLTHLSRLNQQTPFFNFQTFKNSIQSIVIDSSLIVLLLSILYYFVYSLWQKDQVYVIGHDYDFLSSQAYYLVSTRQESIYGVFNMPDLYKGVHPPYHYFDLWIAGILSFISGISPSYINHSFLPMLIMCIVYMSICVVLINKFGKLNWFQKVLIALTIPTTFFTFCGLYDKFSLLRSTFDMSQSFWVFPKNIFITLFFIVFFFLYRNYQKQALSLIIILPFIHIGMSPVVVIFISLVLLNRCFFLKTFQHLSLRDIFFLFSLTILIVGILFLFYNSNSKVVNETTTFQLLQSPKYWFQMVKIAIKTVIDTALLLIPTVILLTQIILQYKNRRKLFLLKLFNSFYPYFLWLSAGLISYLLLNHSTYMAQQFYSLIVFSLLSFLNILAFAYLFIKKRSLATGVFYVLFAVHSIYSFFLMNFHFNNIWVSSKLINQLESRISTDKQALHTGIFFVKPNINNMRTQTQMQPYHLLPQIDISLYAVRGNHLNLEPVSGIWKDNIYYQENYLPIVRYLREKGEHVNNSKEQVLDFIQHYNIKWLTVDPNTYMPEYLKPFVRDSIYDPFFETTVYFLDGM